MKIGRRIVAGMLCIGLMAGFAGCQEDPEGSLVKHKDMEKLISQAAGTQSGTVDAVGLQADVAENYESYQEDISDESLGVKLTVDAQVEVPQVDKLSIYRVQQKKITQELVDKVVNEFFSGETLYDGRAVTTRLRSEVEADIETFRQQLKDMETQMRESGEYTEEDIQQNVDAYQFDIDTLQAEYEAAPETFDLSAYPGDSSLESMREWDNNLVSTLEVINDGTSGSYKSLVVQDSDNYSNQLVYNSGPVGWVPNYGCLVDETYLGAMNPLTANQPQLKGLPGIVLNDYYLEEDDTITPVPGWTCELTAEDAQSQARVLLDKLGFTDFTLGRSELCTETMSFRNPDAPKGDIYAGTYYILKYYRDIDGVPLTQSSGVKYQDGWDSEGTFKKEMWPAECIELHINDSGIVEFGVHAPVEVTETVVEGSGLKSFEEVKSTFESMAAVTRAREYEQVVGEIDKVRLSYSRISEKDRFDTGLIVPVWSFEGKEDYYMEERLDGSWEGTILAVNAVDGSVIDATLGY